MTDPAKLHDQLVAALAERRDATLAWRDGGGGVSFAWHRMRRAARLADDLADELQAARKSDGPGTVLGAVAPGRG